MPTSFAYVLEFRSTSRSEFVYLFKTVLNRECPIQDKPTTVENEIYINVIQYLPCPPPWPWAPGCIPHLVRHNDHQRGCNTEALSILTRGLSYGGSELMAGYSLIVTVKRPESTSRNFQSHHQGRLRMPMGTSGLWKVRMTLIRRTSVTKRDIIFIKIHLGVRTLLIVHYVKKKNVYPIIVIA